MDERVKILVVEDEFIIAEEISEILKLRNYDVVGSTSNSQEAIELVKQHNPDIILLDIHIDGSKDGIQTAEIIRETNNEIVIIYLTAFSDQQHVNRAKETNPAAYIVKPFDERNLLIAIDLAFSNVQTKDTWQEQNGDSNQFILEDRIYIKEKDRYVKLMLKDIDYIEAIGSYSEIFAGPIKHTFSLNLKNLSHKFNHKLLCRVHRSFIVNIDKIDVFQGNQIFIGKKSIPIGSSYRENFAKQFKLI